MPEFVPESHQRNWLGQLLRTLGTGERGVIQHAIEPLLSGIGSPAGEKLRALRREGRDVYGQDVFNAAFPLPEDASPLRRVGQGVGGFAASVAFDPLSLWAPGRVAKGALSAIKGGHRAGQLLRAPSKVAGVSLERAARGLPRLSATARKLGMSPEEVMHALKKANQGADIEPRIVDAFWDAVPDLPDGLSAQLREGFTSFLRFEVPFTGLATDAESLLKQAHLYGLADQVGYSQAWFVDGVTKAAKKMAAATPVGKLSYAVGSRFDKVFGSTLTRRPELVKAGNKMLSAIYGAKGKTAREVAESFGSGQEEIVQLIRQGLPHLGESEIRTKLSDVVGQVIEQTGWDGRSLRSSHYAVSIGEGGTPTFQRLSGGAEARIAEAMDELRFSLPDAGGPGHILDSAMDQKVRQQVIAAHQLNLRQVRLERLKGLNTPALWGDGGYFLHRISDEAKTAMGNAFFKLAGKKPAYRTLPGAQYMSHLMRKWKVIVPDEFENLRPQLEEILVPGPRGKKPRKLFTEADLEGIATGGMDDLKFSKRMYKKFSRAHTHHTRSGRVQGVGLSVEDLQKMIHNYTADEIDEYIFKFGLPNPKGGMLLEAGKIQNFFRKDISHLMVHRAYSGDSKIARREFYKVAQSMGRKIERPSQLKEGEAMINDLAALRGLAFPKSEVTYIKSLSRAYGNVDNAADDFFKQYFDPIQQWWKPWTLLPFLVYHDRNMLGNMWLNHLGGVGISDNVLAAQVRKLLWKNPKSETTLFTHPVTMERISSRKIFLNGEKANLWNSGFMTNLDEGKQIQELLNFEIARTSRMRKKWAREKTTFKDRGMDLKEYVGSEIFPSNEKITAGLLLGKRSPLLQAGSNLASLVEDQGKIAHVINRLKAGDSWEDAMWSAKKHLFDYQRMTNIERKVLRRAFPFYLWARNNIPIQIEYLVKRPYKSMNYTRGIRSLQEMGGVYGEPPDEYISEWLRKSGGIKWRKDKDGTPYFWVPTGWIPVADLHEAFDILSLVKSNMSPIPRATIEHLMNYDLMTGNSIDAMQKRIWSGNLLKDHEMKKLLGVPMPRHAQHFLRSQFRVIKTLDDLFSNPQDLDQWSQFLRLVVGRDYPYSPGKSYASYRKNMRDIVSRYRKAAYSARASGGDVERVRAALKRTLVKEHKGWTGKTP